MAVVFTLVGSNKASDLMTFKNPFTLGMKSKAVVIIEARFSLQ